MWSNDDSSCLQKKVFEQKGTKATKEEKKLILRPSASLPLFAFVQEVCPDHSMVCISYMKRQSIYAEMLSLPLNDARHRRFREELWVAGSDIQSVYFLSVLAGENWLDAGKILLARQALIEYITNTVSAEAGRLLSACRQPMEVAHSYLKYQVAKKEGMADRTKWSKAERLMILLIEHPDWSDEQFIKALKTTPKQLQRLNTFFQMARFDAKRRATS